MPSTKSSTTEFFSRHLAYVKYLYLSVHSFVIFGKAMSSFGFLSCSLTFVDFSDLADELGEYKLHLVEFFNLF